MGFGCLPGLDHIVSHHAHNDHCRAHEGEGAHVLLIEYSYQDGVEHRFDAGDQACHHRGRGLQADGQQDIGQGHLEYPQDHQAEDGGGRELRLLEQEGQAGHRGEDLPPEHRGESVAVGHVVHQKDPGVGHPGKEGQEVAQASPHLQAVHEEEQHPAEHHRAGDQVQPPGPLVPEQQGEHNDENRGGKLKHDGVGRRGQLVGHRIQQVGAEHAHGPQEDPAVQSGRVLGDRQKQPDDYQRDGGAPAVDGDPVPGDHLDAQSADAVEHGRNKYAQHSGAPLCFHMFPSPPRKTKALRPGSPGQRAFYNAVPPLVRPPLAAAGLTEFWKTLTQ